MFRTLIAVVLFLLCVPMTGFGFLQEPKSALFPQNVGDQHTYRKTSLGGQVFEWTDIILQNEGRRFQHSDYWGDGRTRWLLAKKAEKVFEFDNGKKLLWYKFGASEKEEWTIQVMGETPVCVNQSVLRVVGRDEIVSVPAGTFEHCLHLSFEPKCSDAGALQQWFAPNVGLVKQLDNTIGGPIKVELLRARVNGKTVGQN